MKKVLKSIKVLLSTAALSLIQSTLAYAGPVTAETPEAVATKVVTNLKPVVSAFGGAAVFIGVAIIAFQMILSHNNPNNRSSAMQSLMWVGGGAILLGSISLVAGFFWGLGQ